VAVFRRRTACATLILLVALLWSCGGGDTIDGVTTERIVLHTQDSFALSGLSVKEEQALYDKIKGFFDLYYGDTIYTMSCDFSERGEYGGDECYIFRSYLEDGSEGFLLAASVDGTSVYGCDPERGLIALVWCEGWTKPDFSYFGELDTSNL
jgi:hypothetical protein